MIEGAGASGMVSQQMNDEAFFKMTAQTGGSSRINLMSKSAPAPKPKEIYVTPANQPFILGLLSYLAKAKHQVDTRFLDVACKLLKFALQAYQGRTVLKFSRGWADSDAAQQVFYLKFISGVETILSNKYLPIKYHAQLTEIMSGQDNGALDRLVGKVISGETVVKEGSASWQEWRSTVMMCKHFTPRQTEDVITNLRSKHQSANSSLREGLSKHPNKKLVAEIIHTLLLNSNGIVTAQLRSMNFLPDLQSFCLSQINKFLRPRHQGGSPNGFSLVPPPPSNRKHTLKSIKSYLGLLVSLFLIQSGNRILGLQNGALDHQLSEFLAYFFRSCLDKNHPLLTNQTETSDAIKVIIKAMQEHSVYQRNKDELLEVMEILTLFTTNLQIQNQGLVDLLISSTGNQRGLADQSTSISHGAHSHQGSGIPALIVMNKNLIDLSLSQIFEHGILDLVEMESSLDSTFQETSASLKLLNNLIRYLQSLRKTDQILVGCISLNLRLIKILVRNYGVNESIKQAIQSITHKLVKTFEQIVSNVSRDAILQVVEPLFALVLKEVVREDLTVFLMQEISKVFKKSTFNNLLSESFLLMANSSYPLKDNKTNYHIFSTMVNVINQLWHDQLLGEMSEGSFQTLLVALCTVLQKIDMAKGSRSYNAVFTDPKIYQSFVQMWLVIFSYVTEHVKKRGDVLPQLIQLAQLTPYLVYIGEFSLMLRIGTNKDGLERFIASVFQKFPSLNQMPQSLQNSVATPVKEDIAKKGQKGQPPPQTVVELEDDEDEGEEAELAFGEKLFLSIYSQVQEYRMHSLSSKEFKQKLSVSHPHNFVESLLTLFSNDKIESEVFLFKLESLCSYFFDIYLANLKSVELDEQKEKILIQDFIYLLKSCCHVQTRLRTLASNFLQNFTQNYPFLLLKPRVMTTFLDLLDALNTDVYNLYDSLSHTIRLPTTGEQVWLPTTQIQKQCILKELTQVFSDCFVYAEIMSPNELTLTLEAYKHARLTGLYEGSKGKHQQWNATQEMTMNHEPHYGIAFFEYLRSNIDLSRVDFASVQGTTSLAANFHTLRTLAIIKPWSFVKAVEELKKSSPNGTLFSSYHPELSGVSNPGEAELQHFHNVFNVMKKQQLSQIERILSLKPFQGPGDSGLPKNHSGTSHALRLYEVELSTRMAQMEEKLGGSVLNNPEGVHWNASLQVFRELSGKLLKQAMNLDLYYMVKNLIKYNTKEEVSAILKKLCCKAESQNSSAGAKKPTQLQQSMAFGGSRIIHPAHSSLYDASHNIHKMLSQNQTSNFLGSPQNEMIQGSTIGGAGASRDKLGKTLQNLIHQVNKKQYLNELSAKMHHIVGLLVALLHRVQTRDVMSKKRAKLFNTEELSNLSAQILTLLSYVPCLTLCKESVYLLRSTCDLLSIYGGDGGGSLSRHFFSILPLAINAALSKVETSVTHYESDRKIKAFELLNQMKREFSEINEDLSTLHQLEDLVVTSEYDCFHMSDLLTMKQASNSSQQQLQKPMLQFVTGVLYLVQDLIPSQAMTTSHRNLSPISSILSSILRNLSKPLLHAYSTEWFSKTCLLLIKSGLEVSEAQKALRVFQGGAVTRESEAVIRESASLEGRVYAFMMKYLEKEMFNLEHDNTVEFKEEIQLIKDIKYLLEAAQTDQLSQAQQNYLGKYFTSQVPLTVPIRNTSAKLSKFFKLIQHDNLCKREKISYMDLGKTSVNVSRGQTCVQGCMTRESSRDKLVVPDCRLEATLGLYLFTLQEQKVLAWNYSQKMKDFRGQRNQLDLELQFWQDKGRQIISKYPKISIKIWARIGTPSRVLDIMRVPLREHILLRPSLYQWSTDALEIFLDHVHTNKIPPKDLRGTLSEWRGWDFVKMIRYLGFRYHGEYFLNQLALKPFEFVKSKAILQYLPQLFQCLRNDSHNQIQRFLINKSKEFASVAHNVLWYCKVESIPDKSKGRKVPLPLRENLPEVVALLEKNIGRHMTPEGLQFFETETEFFERITSISGLLEPKQSKDEKKAVIREKLIEYNKTIPESVYLPTNTNCRVVGIVTNSGAPMQSAARVPIMISFEVEDYPGPDNDPILTHGLQPQAPANASGDHPNPGQQDPFVSQLARALTEPPYQGGFRLKSAGRPKSQLSVNNGAGGNGSKKQLSGRRGKLSSRRNLLRSHAELMDNDDDDSEDRPIKSQDNLVNDSVDDDENADVPGHDDDLDDSDLHNVSPRQTPAAQIAVLSVKFKLGQYQFTPSQNDNKFSSSFIVRGEDAKLLAGGGGMPRTHRVMTSQQYVGGRSIMGDNNGINEEQKIIIDSNLEGASPGSRKRTIEEAYSGSRSKQILPFAHGQPLDNLKLPHPSPSSISALLQPPKPTVSQLENKKTLYAPLTELSHPNKNVRGKQAENGTHQASLKMTKQYSSNQRKRKTLAGGMVQHEGATQEHAARRPAQVKVVSCIFKVNDDLRQDIIALQVIKLFQKIFKKCGLDLFVAPYKCISNRTGLDKTLGGIIECVPNSHSRDQLGKAFEIDLYQYFLKKFGSEYSNEFKLARLNFIKSLSSYSVVSYILQIKDRHNGNIMIDDWGHIIHIDFGFIFDWSPGKDMRFESADFKLTKEFIDIVGGDQQAEAYQLYVTKTVQAYIAVRQHYPIFRNLIQLMHLSGFPCFKEQSLQKLEERFRLDLQTDLDAANHMRYLIDNAHDKWSTKFYDRIQYLQNKIVF